MSATRSKPSKQRNGLKDLQDPTGRTLAEVHAAEVESLKARMLQSLRIIDQATAEIRAQLAELV